MEGYWNRTLTNRTLSRRRLLGVAGATIGSAAFLAACGGSSSSSDNDPDEPQGGGLFSPSEGTPTPGGRFVFTSQPAAHFSPLADWTQGNFLSGNLVYDRPLTSREDSRRFILEAMESIEQPDPLRVVMKLKPGQTYQDVAPVNGRAVKASDIEATQTFVKSLANATDRNFVDSFLDRCEVPDDLTIIMHLKKPLAYLFGQGFLGNGPGQAIIPAELLNADLPTSTQIGSGPYVLESQRQGVGAVFKKNPKFREAARGLPYIDERESIVIADAVAYEAAFRAGQIDWMHNASASVSQSIERSMPGTVYRIAGIDDGALRWNMSRSDAPWKDIRVREAIWRLTNGQQILELALQNNGILVDGLMATGMPQYHIDSKFAAPYRQEDVAKANQLLQAANWDPNQEVILAGSTAVAQVMEVYGQQIQRGGMKSRIITYTGFGQLMPILQSGGWDCFHDGTPGSGDAYLHMRHQHSDSWSPVYKGFALMDPEIDALIEKSEETIDFEENVKLVKEIQENAMKKFTVAMTYYTPYRNYLIQNRVQNFDLSVTVPVPRHEAWLKA